MDISSVGNLMQPATAPVAPVELPAAQREIVQAVKAVNATEMFGQENELMFQMDRQSRRIVVQVVNRKTKEVVSQIPPEYVLRMAEDLQSSKDQ
ncbi:MAG: flagellar protein FlaG [Acidobacteriia bacterium]|nr:flagellar protein FlaG [Terriglobia bacterium]